MKQQWQPGPLLLSKTRAVTERRAAAGAHPGRLSLHNGSPSRHPDGSPDGIRPDIRPDGFRTLEDALAAIEAYEAEID